MALAPNAPDHPTPSATVWSCLTCGVERGPSVDEPARCDICCWAANGMARSSVQATYVLGTSCHPAAVSGALNDAMVCVVNDPAAREARAGSTSA